eukprot:12234726-Alexandrium_andersonii.AAC.1
MHRSNSTLVASSGQTQVCGPPPGPKAAALPARSICHKAISAAQNWRMSEPRSFSAGRRRRRASRRACNERLCIMGWFGVIRLRATERPLG